MADEIRQCDLFGELADGIASHSGRESVAASPVVVPCALFARRRQAREAASSRHAAPLDIPRTALRARLSAGEVAHRERMLQHLERIDARRSSDRELSAPGRAR